MRWCAFIIGSFVVHHCVAQWDVPVRIVLDGPGAASRQVTGLADPIAPDAAMSVDAVRSSVVGYAVASGTAALTAELFPAPAAYTVGMVVNIVPSQASGRAASLELNGLGPVPIVKGGSLPLENGDLAPGVPARMVYDGARFVMLSSVLRPCPEGSYAVNRSFCIERSSSGPSGFFPAVLACGTRNARLCSLNEWAYACESGASFLGTVQDLEWIDSAGNNPTQAKALGTGWKDRPSEATTDFSCTYGNSVASDSQLRYRCCMNR